MLESLEEKNTYAIYRSGQRLNSPSIFIGTIHSERSVTTEKLPFGLLQGQTLACSPKGYHGQLCQTQLRDLIGPGE